LTQDEERKLRMEAMKAHQRRVKKMVDACPKLFGLILRHMNPESKDEWLKTWTMMSGAKP
jgi:hypothetical protein